MKSLKTLLFALLLALSHSALAKPTQEQAALAGALLDVMGMETALRDTTAMVLDMQLESNPELEPYRQIMIDFLARHMSYAALRDELIAMYAAEFTAAELRAAHAFYASPEGKRFVSLSPRLMQMGGALGERRVTENAAELAAAIKGERARLDAESKANDKGGSLKK